jgi:membrane protein
MLYKLMPRVKISWGDVVAGAVVTALLFSIGKLLIGMYIGKSAVGSGFGAAGSVVVLLVWVYYSAQIVLLGAEFTRVYSQTHGSRKGLLAFEEPVDGTPPARTKSLTAATDDRMSDSMVRSGKQLAR